jgi:hypothetical protein
MEEVEKGWTCNDNEGEEPDDEEDKATEEDE